MPEGTDTQRPSGISLGVDDGETAFPMTPAHWAYISRLGLSIDSIRDLWGEPPVEPSDEQSRLVPLSYSAIGRSLVTYEQFLKDKLADVISQLHEVQDRRSDFGIWSELRDSYAHGLPEAYPGEESFLNVGQFLVTLHTPHFYVDGAAASAFVQSYLRSLIRMNRRDDVVLFLEDCSFSVPGTDQLAMDIVITASEAPPDWHLIVCLDRFIHRYLRIMALRPEVGSRYRPILANLESHHGIDH